MSTVDDAKVPWGFRDGKVVHVSELEPSERGLACGCVCPHCKDRLQARLGSVRIHHFAHNSGRSCDGNRETALHALAKEVLLEHDRFMVPSAEVFWQDRHKTVAEAQYVAYQSVEVEKSFDGFRPDAVLVRPGDKKPLLVEVAVTHFADDEKVARLKELGYPCVEVDLSGAGLDFQKFDRGELERLLIHEGDAFKGWLCIPNEDAYVDELKAEALRATEEAAAAARRKAEERDKTLAGRRAKVERIVSPEYQREAKARRNQGFAGNSNWRYLRRELGIADDANVPYYLDHPVEGEYLFTCNRVIWQSSVFLSWVYRKRLPDREPDIPVWYVADNFLKQHGDMVEKDLVYASKDVWTRPRLPDVFSEYFTFLADCGFVRQSWGDARGAKVFMCTRPEVIHLPAEYNQPRYLPRSRGVLDSETGEVIEFDVGAEG